jgi:hypothetical protein
MLAARAIYIWLRYIATIVGSQCHLAGTSRLMFWKCQGGRAGGSLLFYFYGIDIEKRRISSESKLE